MKDFFLLALTSLISLLGIDVNKVNQPKIIENNLNTQVSTSTQEMVVGDNFIKQEIKSVPGPSKVKPSVSTPSNKLPELPKIGIPNSEKQVLDVYINQLMLTRYNQFLSDVKFEKLNIQNKINLYNNGQQSQKDKIAYCDKTKALELGTFKIESSQRISTLQNSLALRGTLGVSTQADQTLSDARAKEDMAEKSIYINYDMCLLRAKSSEPTDYVDRLNAWNNKMDSYKSELGSLKAGDHVLFFSKLSNFYTELNQQIDYRKSFAGSVDNKDFINHIVSTTENLKQNLNKTNYFTCKAKYSFMPGSTNKIIGYTCGDSSCSISGNNDIKCVKN